MKHISNALGLISSLLIIHWGQAVGWSEKRTSAYLGEPGGVSAGEALGEAGGSQDDFLAGKLHLHPRGL